MKLKTAFKQIRKKRLFVILILIALMAITAVIGYFFTRPKTFDCRSQLAAASASALPVISKKDLSIHDGVQSATIYIGYNCLVYDVTAAKDQYYGVDRHYHYLVGRDASEDLNIFGGELIKRKYKAVGILGN